MECPVCLEDVKEKQVLQCLCDFKACKTCVKQYILSSLQYASCMKCKNEWDMKFLITNFTKAWTTGNKEGQYRHHRKAVLLDREKARIVETMSELPQMKEEAKRRAHHKELRERAKELRKELRDINHELRGYWNHSQGDVYKPQFICPCPYDECRGMIESVNSGNPYTCTVCENKVCRRCREPTDDDHECNQDTLQNLKLVRKDTKPCPTCAAAIHRIEGCDQMHCVLCHVTFSWETGKLETGTVHNPHALRWMRERGDMERDIRDVPCGGLVNFWWFNKLVPKHWYNIISAVYQVIAEIDYRLRVNRDTGQQKFSELRVNYVLGNITEKKWKQGVFLAQRNADRKRANRDILNTFQILGVERFRELHKKLTDRDDEDGGAEKIVSRFFGEMMDIRDFINEAFASELPPLGLKNHLYVDKWGNGKWFWSEIMNKEK